MAIESGCVNYAHGTTTVTAHFPKDRITCQYCKFVRYEYGVCAIRCGITDEPLPYFKDRIGYDCPLDFDDGSESEGE